MASLRCSPVPVMAPEVSSEVPSGALSGRITTSRRPKPSGRVRESGPSHVSIIWSTEGWLAGSCGSYPVEVSSASDQPSPSESRPEASRTQTPGSQTRTGRWGGSAARRGRCPPP